MKKSPSKKVPRYQEGYFFNQWLALGIPLGLPVGLALGNIALGPAIGVGIGAIVGTIVEKKKNPISILKTFRKMER